MQTNNYCISPEVLLVTVDSINDFKLMHKIRSFGSDYMAVLENLHQIIQNKEFGWPLAWAKLLPLVKPTVIDLLGEQ